jgi:hypothetical protein
MALITPFLVVLRLYAESFLLSHAAGRACGVFV